LGFVWEFNPGKMGDFLPERNLGTIQLGIHKQTTLPSFNTRC
jgi:hypothetical protein